MANDPYSMCPCGSGKKLKFCCGDILTDLQKAFRLRENQPEAAARAFRDLLKKHPEKDVLVRELSGTLFELGQTQEARQVCLDYLKAHPDQPNVLASLSEICLKEDGFDASRRLLHRTFQLCAKSNPLAVAYLAALIASMMARSGCLMSAREHLALAVRMSTGERQRNLVLQLVSFESESSLPFPFRSAYQFLPVSFNDDATQQDLRARKLSVLGCWEPAAIIYNRLADAFPTEGSVWFNLGLCQAWDGRLREAASSLHHAATLLQDFDQATDAEALAQQIDLQLSEERYSTLSVKLEVQSVSELLTRLESEPTIRRHDTHDHSECHHHDGTQHVAEFVMLNSDVDGKSISSPDQVPESIADIDLFDVVDEEDAAASEEAKPFLVVTTVETNIDAAIVKLRSLAGDLILTRGDQEKRETVEFERPQARPFDRRFYCPEGLTQKTFRSLTRQLEPAAIEQWLTLPLSALGGKTALEAAGDASLHRKLSGALLVMLSIAGRFDQSPDLDGLRTRLGLPARQSLEIPEGAVVAAMPALSYERLVLTKLTDSQLQELANRCSVLGLRDIVRKALDEIIKRPACLQAFGARRAYLMRAAIARVEEQPDLAYSCLENARGAVEPGPEAFRTQLELDVRELSYRLDDPADPKLKELLHKFRDRYLHKIPEIEQVIIEQLESAGCPELASELEGGLAQIGTSASGGLWTPGAEAAAPAGKLWLPGQS